jgi:hypothetical protein
MAANVYQTAGRLQIFFEINAQIRSEQFSSDGILGGKYSFQPTTENEPRR